MKRPKISEENNDLLDQVNYLIEMDKYCDYLEEQNKQLSIHGVVVSDCLGVKVDKSKATHKKEIRETVFKKGSSLNNN